MKSHQNFYEKVHLFLLTSSVHHFNPFYGSSKASSKTPAPYRQLSAKLSPTFQLQDFKMVARAYTRLLKDYNCAEYFSEGSTAPTARFCGPPACSEASKNLPRNSRQQESTRINKNQRTDQAQHKLPPSIEKAAEVTA